MVKSPPASAGDVRDAGSISGLGRSPRDGNRVPTPVLLSFPGGSDNKESTCNVGNLGSSPGLGRSLEEDMETHSSILTWRIPVDTGTWPATVRVVTKSQTGLND